MLIKELRAKNKNELLQLVNDLKAELFMLRFKNSTGQLEQPHKISLIKKDVAMVFTVINEKEKTQKTSKPASKPKKTQKSVEPKKESK